MKLDAYRNMIAPNASLPFGISLLAVPGKGGTAQDGRLAA